jgi:hypothetical protein
MGLLSSPRQLRPIRVTGPAQPPRPLLVLQVELGIHAAHQVMVPGAIDSAEAADLRPRKQLRIRLHGLVEARPIRTGNETERWLAGAVLGAVLASLSAGAIRRKPWCGILATRDRQRINEGLARTCPRLPAQSGA